MKDSAGDERQNQGMESRDDHEEFRVQEFSEFKNSVPAFGRPPTVLT